MRRTVGAACAVLFGTAISFVPGIADAHIGITSGMGFANATQVIKFGVGHGCAGLDTVAIRIDIPAGVTSVRAFPSDFGRLSVETDATGVVTSVTWQKSDSLPGDFAYYELALRAKLPNTPFTNVAFPTHQTCMGADGGTVVTDWVSLDPANAEPAPVVKVVPSRTPGWNKITVTQAVADVATYFGDSLIVWKGNSAYSPNQATADLIKNTTGVTALTSLAASDEIWVKY